MATASSRWTFTEEEYEKKRKTFWFVPPKWAAPQFGNPLARWWHSGGVGLISILPILGRIARSQHRNDFTFPVEKLGRLTGTDVKSIGRARRVLADEKLAFVKQKRSLLGLPVAHWAVSPALAATPRESAQSRYFLFSLELLYGGKWALLPPSARALYIAAALMASSFAGDIHQCRLLMDSLPAGLDLSDMELCQSLSNDGTSRFAILTRAALAEMSGLNPETVSRNLRPLKHPAHWAGATADPMLLSYSPVWVYPTRGPAVLLFFRDHAPHWPWELLNHPQRGKLGVSKMRELLPSEPTYNRHGAPSYERSSAGNDVDDFPF